MQVKLCDPCLSAVRTSRDTCHLGRLYINSRTFNFTFYPATCVVLTLFHFLCKRPIFRSYSGAGQFFQGRWRNCVRLREQTGCQRFLTDHQQCIEARTAAIQLFIVWQPTTLRVYTYESVLDVREIDLRDLLLELLRILDHPDAAVDVVLEAVNVRRQVTSLTNTTHARTHVDHSQHTTHSGRSRIFETGEGVRGKGCWEECPPPHCGCAPSREKCLNFLISK